MKFQFDKVFSENLLSQEKLADDGESDLVYTLNPTKCSAQDFKVFSCNFMFDMARSVTQIPDLLTKLDENLRNHNTLIEEVSSLKTKVRDLEADASVKSDDITALQATVHEQGAELKSIKEELLAVRACADKDRKAAVDESLALERHSREWNVRMMNIDESPGETTPQCIDKINATIKRITGYDIEIEYGHRSGRKNEDAAKPRVIIARIASRQQRYQVLSKRKEFFNADIPIYEDLPQADLKEKLRFAKEMKKFYNAKRKVSFHHGHWYVDGNVYTG